MRGFNTRSSPQLHRTRQSYRPHFPTNHALDQAKAHELTQLGAAQAAAIVSKGEAEAKVRSSDIQQRGVAEAAAILAKGEAEAKVLYGAPPLCFCFYLLHNSLPRSSGNG